MADKPYPFLNFQEGVDWKDVNPALLKNMNALAQGTGQTITVTSGYRSYAKQAALYNRYIDSGKDIRYIAAPPGKSEHNTGNALDAVVNGTPVGNFYDPKVMAKYGLSAPVAGDPVHTQLASKSSYRAGAGSGDVAGAGVPPAAQNTGGGSPGPFFDTTSSHPADIQPNVGVSSGGPGSWDQQLAGLWQSIANQQFSSPESKALYSYADLSVP